ncbi:MAG TPA: hypothetical protein VKA68_14210 [bacterium]|nr:hypothetical protein [bacterium]
MKLYEIVIQHRPEIAHAFLRGFVLGRNRDEHFFECAECNISTAHLKKHIADRLGLSGKFSNYVTEESLLEPLKEAVEEAKSILGIELHEVYEVTGLRFDFTVNVFNKRIGNQLKQILEQRDDTIQLQGYDPKEVVHEEAEGAELYAPEHDYELRGKGRAEGPFLPVLTFYEQLEEIDQVESGKMALLIAENS